MDIVSLLDELIDVVEDRLACGEVLSDEVGSALAQFLAGVCDHAALLVLRECVELRCAESDHVAGARQPDGPHSSVAALFDVTGCVADLHALRGWEDAEEL